MQRRCPDRPGQADGGEPEAPGTAVRPRPGDSRGSQGLGEGAGPLVLTRGQGKPLNDKDLRWLVGEQGITAVPHGFRSSFRDWAAEETDHPREVIEAARAHVVRSRVEAAYARSDLFDRRRTLMDDWAAYLDGEPRPDDTPGF